MLVIKLCNAL
uniref:Uncharacterized protein n=1 Tax=Lepeophtheirus salmonis TaxID=72036 RepID=A0A0K2VIF2_LEPSM